MNLFDDEKEIMHYYQTLDYDVLLLTNQSTTKHIHHLITDKECWKNWTCSSGKADPPPDFYSDKYKLMMEVMRVDDHAHKNKKGKIVNPLNIKESKLQTEIRKHIDIPNTTKVIVNAVTNLPTREDHNYDFYLKNFSRVINKHKENVELYKTNHKGYKLVFFLFDESSAYVEVDTKEIAQKGAKQGEPFIGRPHCFFFDKAFIDTIKECGADFVIWFTPFKHIDTHGAYPQLPKTVVIDVKKLNELDCIETYDSDYIMSSEE